MVRLISRQRGGLAALKVTKLFGIDDFTAAKDSGKVLIIIIYIFLFNYYYYYPDTLKIIIMLRSKCNAFTMQSQQVATHFHCIDFTHGGFLQIGLQTGFSFI